ncbi:MAG: DUF86 domain-containing protein [Phycisphaerae bacterium]|nr:DUF86 domain-containing protein [Phycisphaerae bacterium]
MPRDLKVYLEDILTAVEKIRRYAAGLSLDTFARDEKTLDAVVRNLEVIGEAVKQIPEDVRVRHPQVEWKKIAGLRDILIHAYFGIDLEIVWDIVQNKLPALEPQVRQILLSFDHETTAEG